jgi:hypothetical protein
MKLISLPKFLAVSLRKKLRSRKLKYWYVLQWIETFHRTLDDLAIVCSLDFFRKCGILKLIFEVYLVYTSWGPLLISVLQGYLSAEIRLHRPVYGMWMDRCLPLYCESFYCQRNFCWNWTSSLWDRRSQNQVDKADVCYRCMLPFNKLFRYYDRFDTKTGVYTSCITRIQNARFCPASVMAGSVKQIQIFGIQRYIRSHLHGGFMFVFLICVCMLMLFLFVSRSLHSLTNYRIFYITAHGKRPYFLERNFTTKSKIEVFTINGRMMQLGVLNHACKGYSHVVTLSFPSCVVA